MAALGNLNKNAALWAHSRYSPEEWKSIEPEERANAVDEVIEEQKAEQLSTIFFLLREFPLAVAPSTVARKAHEFRDSYGNGMISSLYLLLVYARTDDGEYIVLQSNLELLENAIDLQEIPSELEAWWSKLKFWIRYCYKSEIKLQNDDGFLLHAAVSNPDVPPLLIELLIAIFPDSATIPVNGTTEYPLHIAAATPRYAPQPFEKEVRKSAIQALFDAHPKAAVAISPSGTPYEIARLKRTRSEDEMKVLRENQGSYRSFEEEEEKEEIGLGDQG
jgi:hypothetical protein